MITIEISEVEMRNILKQAIEDKIGRAIKVEHIVIEVKSKQNYKSEWENAAFRATYHDPTPWSQL